MYVGYAARLLPFPLSIPALKPSPQTVDPYRDRSRPDTREPNFKKNNSSSPKPREMELRQIQKELGDSDLRPEPICIPPSKMFVFPSSQALVPSSRNQAK